MGLYEIKQWDMENRIREELRNPNFLKNYTRKSLREVMLGLYPEHRNNKYAFRSMTKNRMYRHILATAILKKWLILNGLNY